MPQDIDAHINFRVYNKLISEFGRVCFGDQFKK